MAIYILQCYFLNSSCSLLFPPLEEGSAPSRFSAWVQVLRRQSWTEAALTWDPGKAGQHQHMTRPEKLPCTFQVQCSPGVPKGRGWSMLWVGGSCFICKQDTLWFPLPSLVYEPEQENPDPFSPSPFFSCRATRPCSSVSKRDKLLLDKPMG